MNICYIILNKNQFKSIKYGELYNILHRELHNIRRLEIYSTIILSTTIYCTTIKGYCQSSEQTQFFL